MTNIQGSGAHIRSEDTTSNGQNDVQIASREHLERKAPLTELDARTASVACVIPCYNCTDTLLRAVRSVQAQSVPVQEIILVDDCSTDETTDLIERLAAEDPRIVPLHIGTNSGPSTARNAGWERARSRFIAFLDADDSWHKQKVELQLRLFQAWPDLAIAGHIASVEGEVEEDERYDLSDADLAAHARPVQRRSLLIRNPWSTPTVMLRRDIPFRFDEDQREAEDFLLWARILMSGRLGLRLKLPLAILYKARYGARGLSANLWKMQKGELRSFRKLWQRRDITAAEYCFASLLSLVKFIRRSIRSQ